MDQALRQYLSEAFESSSSFDAAGFRDLIRDGVRDFQQHAKREFISYEQEVSIQVAWRNVNDVSLDISHGVMHLPGYVSMLFLTTVTDGESSPNSKTVHSFFSLCVDRMIECLRIQLSTPGITVSSDQLASLFVN